MRLAVALPILCHSTTAELGRGSDPCTISVLAMHARQRCRLLQCASTNHVWTSCCKPTVTPGTACCNVCDGEPKRARQCMLQQHLETATSHVDLHTIRGKVERLCDVCVRLNVMCSQARMCCSQCQSMSPANRCSLQTYSTLTCQLLPLLLHTYALHCTQQAYKGPEI
ncbi:hypothetical protein COO60DRAFT_1485754, partial [Scenedesmus sp. NREL 46B-D3]